MARIGIIAAAGCAALALAVLWRAGELPRWREGGAAMIRHSPLPPLAAAPLLPQPGQPLVCEGDSNVAGASGWQPFSARRRVAAWCEDLGKRLNLPAIRRGVGGSTAGEGLGRWPAAPAGSLVILLYGTNDAAPRGLLSMRAAVPPDRYRDQLAAIAARHRAAGASVLVLAPLPAGSAAIDARIMPYRKAAREAARQAGAAFADPVEAFADGAASPLDYDALHMTAAGHRAMARWLEAWLSQPPPAAGPAPAPAPR